ncbi:MAG: hypothetical protein ACOYO7_10825, partial [Phycisphaerales bacterium]
ALRARTAEGAVAAFHWVHSRLSTEWCRTFMHDMVRSMTSKELQAPLAEALVADPQFKAFAKDTREVMATP